jgi:hypothetical protein
MSTIDKLIEDATSEAEVDPNRAMVLFSKRGSVMYNELEELGDFIRTVYVKLVNKQFDLDDLELEDLTDQTKELEAMIQKFITTAHAKVEAIRRASNEFAS